MGHIDPPSIAVPDFLALAPGWGLGSLTAVGLLYLGLVILIGVAARSRQSERSFSASVFYVGLGALAAAGLSWLDVSPLDPEADHGVLERICELALVVAVFSAGLVIERTVRRRSWVSIATLLLVVMPLTIVAIAAFGMLAMCLSFGAALVLGAILAPTDPVLAGDVGLAGVGGEVYGEPRLSLHTEAGFNDGLASPFVVLGLLVAERGGTGWLAEWVLADLIYAAGLALAFGVVTGLGASWLATRLRAGGLLASHLDGFLALGIVLVIYGATEAGGGYGLLAVFAAGFAFRRHEFEHEVHHGVHVGAEVAGTSLELLVLLLLGSMLTLEGMEAPGVGGWLLAPLLILLIRPSLVLATAPPGLMDLGGKLFLGFFGVRGVAALFYAAVVVESGALERGEQHTVVWTTLVVVVVSIVVHGLSATPLTRRLL